VEEHYVAASAAFYMFCRPSVDPLLNRRPPYI